MFLKKKNLPPPYCNQTNEHKTDCKRLNNLNDINKTILLQCL